MTDFRALCVELTDCLEKADWPHRYKVVFQQWTDIARAALAEPEPPSLPEITHNGSSSKPTAKELQSLWQACNSPSVFARAILARFGNHQGMLASSIPRPIPVSERLPEMDDCDADGRCWVGYLVTEEMEDEDLNPSWELCQINPNDEYWLPANALPQPS